MSKRPKNTPSESAALEEAFKYLTKETIIDHPDISGARAKRKKALADMVAKDKFKKEVAEEKARMKGTDDEIVEDKALMKRLEDLKSDEGASAASAKEVKIDVQHAEDELAAPLSPLVVPAGHRAKEEIEKLSADLHGAIIAGLKADKNNPNKAAKNGGVAKLDLSLPDKDTVRINGNVYGDDQKSILKHALTQMGGFQVDIDADALLKSGMSIEMITKTLRTVVRRRRKMGKIATRADDIDQVRKMDLDKIKELYGKR